MNLTSLKCMVNESVCNVEDFIQYVIIHIQASLYRKLHIKMDFVFI